MIFVIATTYPVLQEQLYTPVSLKLFHTLLFDDRKVPDILGHVRVHIPQVRFRQMFASHIYCYYHLTFYAKNLLLNIMYNTVPFLPVLQHY